MPNRPAADPQDTALDAVNARLEELDQRLAELDRKLDWIITWITAEQDEIPAPPGALEEPVKSPKRAQRSDARGRPVLVASLLTGLSAAARMVGFRTVRAD
jgi:hypothetical protein